MRRWLTRAAVIAAGATLCFGSVAAVHAEDDDATTSSTPPSSAVIAATGSVTLPLFGVPLTLEVSTDPSGQIASVDLTSADAFTAVVDRPRNVTFVNDAGTAKVRVEARRGAQSVSARGTTLADISGPGSWSGDPLGSGSKMTVNFVVGATADGGPDITGVTSTDSSATIGLTQHDSGGRGNVARASVTFSSGDQQRTLFITAAVVEADETSRASISVSLSRIRGVSQAPADAAGAKTWSGLLCDGSPAQVNYTVAQDGSVSAVSATPSDAQVKTNDKSIDVRFTTGERVRIRVRTNDGGQIAVNVEQRFRCDITDPTVNTPTSTTDDDHGHGHHGGPGKGDDDHTSTPSTGSTPTSGSTPTTSEDGGRHGGDHNGSLGRGGHGRGGRG